MDWGPEKRAGFLLAALLAEDRGLEACEPALAPALHRVLARALSDARTRKAESIAAWVAVLRPALTDATRALPARARALLAPLARPPLRRALLEHATPPRPHFSADPALLTALLRIARQAGRGSADP